MKIVQEPDNCTFYLYWQEQVKVTERERSSFEIKQKVRSSRMFVYLIGTLRKEDDETNENVN